MGQYLGKEELENEIARLSSHNQNLIKGLSAELNVGKLLEKHLPSDTYVIVHPIIGLYDPDILVISPRYGFRIIEVKNWDPSNISGFGPNGSVYFNNQESANPMGQVKKHRDELWKYLKASFTISNATVDCLVLHYGMDKDKFQKDFDKNWDSDFYKNTIFRDQLNEDIDNVLRYSPKVNSRGISTETIQKIVNNIKISDKKFKEGELIETVTEKEKEIEEYEGEKKTVTKLVYVVIAMLLVMTVGIFKMMPSDSKQEQSEKDTGEYQVVVATNPDTQSNSQGLPLELDDTVPDATKPGEAAPTALSSNPNVDSNSGNTISQSNSKEPQPEVVESEPINNSQITISEMIGDDQNIDKQFELSLLVKKFNYDPGSETKFLLLSDGSDTIEGVIFKNTPGIPYISVNSTYRITGTLSVYDSKLQLIISSVME